MRFEGERLWRTLEFFAGAVVTLIAAAAAASGLTSVVSEAAPPALAIVAVAIACLGLLVLNAESYYFVRDRRVWRRLLHLQASAEVLSRSLDLEAKMLTASTRDLEGMSVGELAQLAGADLLPEPGTIVAAGGVRATFEWILLTLGLVAAVFWSYFDLLAIAGQPFTALALELWIAESAVVLFLPIIVLIPGVVDARKLRRVWKGAHSQGSQNAKG